MYKLMIKHYTNGKKYLCQTQRDDWETYLGSGNNVRNSNLILESTTLIGLFETKEELKQVGKKLSAELDVVDSSDFLNDAPEEGQGGYTSYTEERNSKISSKLKGKPKSEEHKAKISANRKGFVSAWDKEQNKNVQVTAEEFYNNSNLIGIAAVTAKGVPKSEEWKQKMRKPKSEEHKAKLRVPNPKKSLPPEKHGRSKPITLHGVDYPSVSTAVRELGVNAAWILRRLRSDKYPDSFYQEK